MEIERKKSSQYNALKTKFNKHRFSHGSLLTLMKSRQVSIVNH